MDNHQLNKTNELTLEDITQKVEAIRQANYYGLILK
jgi:hypothetical protein